eukprot:scaffold6785_cov166-Skeletonema_menzelii.AAC.5
MDAPCAQSSRCKYNTPIYVIRVTPHGSSTSHLSRSIFFFFQTWAFFVGWNSIATHACYSVGFSIRRRKFSSLQLHAISYQLPALAYQQLTPYLTVHQKPFVPFPILPYHLI